MFRLITTGAVLLHRLPEALKGRNRCNDWSYRLGGGLPLPAAGRTHGGIQTNAGWFTCWGVGVCTDPILVQHWQLRSGLLCSSADVLRPGASLRERLL